MIVIVISVMVILCCYSRQRRWPVLSIVRATRRNQRSSLPTANTWCKASTLMIKYLLIPAVLASYVGLHRRVWTDHRQSSMWLIPEIAEWQMERSKASQNRKWKDECCK